MVSCYCGLRTGLVALGATGAGAFLSPQHLPTVRTARVGRARGDVVALFGGLFGGGGASSASPPAKAPPGAIADTGPNIIKLYDGYFNSDLQTQIVNSLKAAIKDGVQYMEVYHPPLPNMEEIDFGTLLNQKFVEDLTRRLQCEDFLIKRNKVKFANVDMANRLGGSLGRKTYVLSFDNVVRPSDIALNKNVLLLPVSQGLPADATCNDLVIVLSPGVDEQWKRATKLTNLNVPVVALNPPFSLKYDIGQGGRWEAVYLMKRISRGWVYRAYPGPFKAYLETPDNSKPPILLNTYESKPTLREVAALVREESNRRFGPLNDRYLDRRL